MNYCHFSRTLYQNRTILKTKIPNMQRQEENWTESILRIMKSKTSLIGFCIILILIITALFAPFIATHSPTEQSIINQYQEPSSEHLLGTDALGRDIFSRIVYGTRISIQIGVIAVGISMIIGVLLGAVAGYFGNGLTRSLCVLLIFYWLFPVFCWQLLS